MLSLNGTPRLAHAPTRGGNRRPSDSIK